MKHSMIITVLALKLYLGHRRNEDEIAKQIGINERNASFQYGYNKNIMAILRKEKPSNGIWSDDIIEILNNREIEIVNKEQILYIATRNESIMNYAAKYMNYKKLNKKILLRINYVRSFKQMYLPCKLVDLNGQKATKELEDIYTKSCLK